MNQAIFRRDYYLNKIRGFYKSDLIKVITGIRRCGKSCFLQSVIEDLKADGVLEKDIININLDKYGFIGITTAEQLDKCLQNRITDTDFKYIFIDEIQNVIGFETLINAYREEGRFSIFITGSNSYLLSGELVTKLTGRYIEIEMYPLNFQEFLAMKKFKAIEIRDASTEFMEYIRHGGFPKTIEFPNEQDKDLYVENVIQQVIEKDVIKYRQIRNKSVFNKVMNYVINNFGSTTSIKSIAEHFKKQENLPIKIETINGYLKILENAKIINRCSRFDVKSKKSLMGEQKYYLADLGIYFSRNTDQRINFGPALENILYTYLRAKGYHLSVGRIGKLECDFITQKNGNYNYIQIAMTIGEQKTEDREYEPFKHIRDNYPKYLFTLDPLLQKRDGILHKNLVQFIAADLELE